MSIDREVVESPYEMSEGESQPFEFDWSNIGTPTSPTHKLLERTPTAGIWVDVSSSKITGGSTISGNKAISGAVASLEDGKTYMLISRVTISGRTLESFLMIKGVV